MGNKIYYIASIHRNHRTIWKGTMDHLIHDVFGYTLECGNSWNRTINREPKTGPGLVSALNKSAYACNRYFDQYELSSEEEYTKAGGWPDYDSVSIKES